MQPARLAVKTLAAVGDLVGRRESGLVVLIYHRVGRRTHSEVDLPLDLFERQLRFLSASTALVTLDEGLSRITSTQPCGEPAVAVTFDDGTADFCDLAVPLLVRYSIPITLYVASDFLDSGRNFPGDGKPASWAALRDARSTGLVEVGSHTHRHSLLDRLKAEEVREELDRSIESIGAALGVPPLHFAYPKAVPGSSHADREVRARFASAALAGTRPNPYGSTDVYRLARSPIQLSDGYSWFVRKAKGGMQLEDVLRRGVNRRRYRDFAR